MSKQSEAKKAQGYVEKSYIECSTCENFTLDREEIKSKYSNTTWVEDKNLRCSIGGFAVKKRGRCKLHKFKSS